MNPKSLSAPLKVHCITVGELQTNCYLIFEEKTKTCIIIDPGAEGEKIEKETKKKNLNVVGIVNTHGHPDHISADNYLKKVFSCPVYIHPLDAEMLDELKNNIVSFLYFGDFESPHPDEFIKDKSLKIGNIEFEVIHTPGHTPGSICLIANNFVITGDTLFCGSVGRCDLPGGDESKLMESLKKLIVLPGDYAIYPGHGPQCTISDELKHNPFIAEIL